MDTAVVAMNHAPTRPAPRLCRPAAAALAVLATLTSLLLAACVTQPPALDTQRLADELQRRPNVLLGEVHDNRAQHAVRAEALRLLLERGARPALAFEQIDREQRAAVDAARRAELPAGTARVDHLIAQAGARGARGWDWALYRPYLALALQYDLPIVAANLSRTQANQATRDGFAAVFDAPTRARLQLDALPAALVAAQAEAVNLGHCQLLPPAAAQRLARPQIARDAMLAESIRPYLAPGGRGVILLTGNGHVRNDIGVPFFLSPVERASTRTIGFLEDAFVKEARAAGEAGPLPQRFDALFISVTQQRDDPCEGLREQMRELLPASSRLVPANAAGLAHARQSA
jgi:uncharacterized iron-regulated protein